jgi:hypothetical protein
MSGERYPVYSALAWLVSIVALCVLVSPAAAVLAFAGMFAAAAAGSAVVGVGLALLSLCQPRPREDTACQVTKADIVAEEERQPDLAAVPDPAAVMFSTRLHDERARPRASSRWH